MPEDAHEDERSSEGAGSTADSGERPSKVGAAARDDGAAAGERSRKGPAVAAIIAAAAVGTTAVAANRVLKGRAGNVETPGGGTAAGPDSTSGGEVEPSLLSRAARNASRRGEPLVQALVETGWDAVKTSVAPAAERMAGPAGRFAATDATEFVRETLLPPFIEAYEQARTQETERPS